MKKLVYIFIFLSSYSLAQQRICGSVEKMQKYTEMHPETIKKRLILETLTSQFNHNLTKNTITIPVVIHILYNNMIQNISDMQVHSQIDVLNEDFTRTNQDAWNTPIDFMSVVADMQINFCLAKQDPNGHPTGGIIRKQTSIPFFPLFDNSIYFDSLGGSSAWDTQRYLNIWVCKVEDGFLGWAQFPGSGDLKTDGVVIDFEHFGTVGTAKSPYNLGRTATHEIGHWFNLIHIWGDNNCGDDLVNDTPIQEDANFGCLAHPAFSCGNTGDMFMNFMDYTNDACMNSFTQGQRNRVWSTIYNYRNTLLNSNGCQLATIANSDAGIIEIVEPNNQMQECSSPIYPKVIIKNFGSTILNTVIIKYKVDASGYHYQQWNGSLLQNEIDTILLSPINTSQGISHLLYCSTEMPNNTQDINPINDEINKIYNSINGQLINVEIMTDNYANETSWELLDANYTIIASGDNLINNTLYTHEFCLENNCYTLVLHDSAGDGFCCNFGNGYYTIFLKNNQIPLSSGTLTSSSDSILFCTASTAANQDMHAEKLIIYPNPSNGKIYINVSDFYQNTSIFANAKIFNNLGRLVFENEIEKNKVIYLENLANGIYLIQVEIKNKQYTRKFILKK